MAWVMLVIAIAAEVVGTTALAVTHGGFRPGPIAVVVAGYVVSFVAMAQALRTLDIAVVYAIWSALGTAAIAVIGAVAFGQPITWQRGVFLVVIVVGVAGLELSGGPGG